MSFARRHGWWRGWVLLALAAAALLIRCDDGPGPGGGDGAAPREQLGARVLEVVDGDTVAVELDGGGRESVRYIGIDTPESNPDQPLECFGPQAEEANRRLVEGRSVALELGAEPRDDYDRLLAYVRVETERGGEPTLVNAELVRTGFARTLTIAPNDRLAPLLRRLETAAARAGRGLWGACGK